MLYAVRLVMMSIWFFGISLVSVLLALPRPFRAENGTRFCRLLAPGALWILNIRFIVRNRERLDSSRPCVMLGNHQSTLDMFVYTAIFPERSVTLGKKSIKWIPIFGWLYWLADHILIDREHPDRAIATMQKAAVELQRKKLSVLIFPEGTRSHGGPMRPFKKGAFHLAVTNGLPLQPIVMSPIHKHLDYRKWCPGTVIAEVLEPIPTKGKTLEDVDALLAEAQQKMAAAFARLDAELEAGA